MKLTFKEKHAIRTATAERDYCFLAHGLTSKSLWNKGLAVPTSGFGHKWGAIYQLTDKVREFSPPPNPAKITDPRAKWYLDQFGQSSWEVDALRPDVMTRIVREHITDAIDMETFYEITQVEDLHKTKMKEFAQKEF